MKQLITALSILFITTTAFAEPNTINFNIPAQKAATALIAFGEQADRSVVVDNSARDVNITGIQGSYGVREAMEQMLMGSGLTYRITDNSIVVSQADVDGAQNNAVDTSDTEDASRKSTYIEEVIVTAEKRAESIQDIPIAISAITGDTINRSGMTEVNDLKMSVPSLQFGNSGSPSISLRGVGQQTGNIGSESGVLISEDGMPLAHNFMLNSEFLDVERVEVLRGPQGTINGRNATGGAINLYSNRPTEELEGRFKAGVGNYSRFSTEGVLSGPLGESGVLGRFAFRTDRADGWLKNTLLDEETHTTDETQVRASLLARLNEDLEALLILEAFFDRSPADRPVQIGRLRPDTPTASENQGFAPNKWKDLEFQANRPYMLDVAIYKSILKLTWDISSTSTLTSTTGYAHDNGFNTDIDWDGTGADLEYYPYVDGYMRQVSQELTLTTDLTDKLDMILGGFYLHATAKEPIDIALPGFGIPAGELVFLPDQVSDSYAIYTQWRYQLTDELRIALGARYTYDEKEYVEDRLFGPSVGGPFTVSLRGSDSWDAFTPRVAVDYTPTDDFTLYASVSRGYKAGGFSTYGADPADPSKPDVFDPEYVLSYEVGAKGYWLDHRLRTAVAVFYLDYTDFQAGKYINNGGALVLSTENAAAATVKGVELELEAQITQSFKLSATGSWLDATFDELQSGDITFPELNDPITGVRDLADNRIPQTPKWQFSISGEYTAPLGRDYQGILRADYQWQAKQFYDIYNNEVLMQESYGLLNIHAALETVDGQWQFTAYARNVLDERYLTDMAALNSWGSVNGYIGMPRTYGVSLEYNF